MSLVICEGACNGGYRRATALHDQAVAAYEKALAELPEGAKAPAPPAPPQIQPWHGDPTWCTSCTAQLHRQLADLDNLGSMLAALPPAPDGPDDGEGAGRVHSSPEPRSASPAADVLEDLAGWLRDWEGAVRGEGSLYRHGYLATERTEMVSWLSDHFAPAITNPDLAGDFGTEIRTWHRKLSAMAVAGQAKRHMKRKCPRCSLYTLWWTIGQEYVRCINEDCNRMMTRPEYDTLTSAA